MLVLLLVIDALASLLVSHVTMTTLYTTLQSTNSRGVYRTDITVV
jgi:hypothetical protein